MDMKTLYQRVVSNREKIDLSLKGVERHDLLLTAYSSCGDGLANAVGYCLQIREGTGEEGSDNQVFLRHLDGSIVMHYDQIFYRVAAQDKADVLALFATKPEDETEMAFTCPDGITLSGFRVPLEG
uniref:hypothetical protein n=1 Tax=Thaumasiovibrio occultus TaxID=1891184 RepID=UPI000B350B6D|nr:hypothetical protein [Thaumasiovibrio occultus]